MQHAWQRWDEMRNRTKFSSKNWREETTLKS
jgi:hypothetical protein